MKGSAEISVAVMMKVMMVDDAEEEKKEPMT